MAYSFGDSKSLGTVSYKCSLSHYSQKLHSNPPNKNKVKDSSGKRENVKTIKSSLSCEDPSSTVQIFGFNGSLQSPNYTHLSFQNPNQNNIVTVAKANESNPGIESMNTQMFYQIQLNDY